MERRHRGVGIRRRGVRRRGDAGHRGDVDERPPGQQPRRRDRVEPEDGEADHVDEDQRVARLAVDVRAEDVTGEENEQRHRQVGELVVPAGRALTLPVICTTYSLRSFCATLKAAKFFGSQTI